jgi:chaperonin GroES
MPKTITPLYDRVLLEKVTQEMSAGGIIIPEGLRDSPSEYKVLAVGTGYLDVPTGKTHPLTVEPGMRVLVGRHSGNEVQEDRKTYLVVREMDIAAIVKED